MTILARSRVACAFDAAPDYAGHARVQHRIALKLAERISSLPRPREPRVLEIGCGTGFLTRALLERDIDGDWLVTDIAPAMLRRCADALPEEKGTARLEFATLDGERASLYLPNCEFDLICSSFVFQWFAELEQSLSDLTALLAPGGALAFTTLISGTFDEWQAAHRKAGFGAGGLTYLTVEQLAACFPEDGELTMNVHTERDDFADASDFLRSLKQIGASTPRSDWQPLSPAGLRRVMAEYDAMGAFTTYRIAICVWTRDE